MAKEVHAAGGKIAPQLWHQGMMRKPGTGPHPDGKSDGPSGLAANGKLVGEPMTDEDIADTIEAFAKAAAASKEIGFDCVELHGAHGYLIDQFFWDGANKRTDIWGGDLVRRTRFAAEIVKAVRKRVGPDYVIIQRFSQWKQQDYTARLALTPKELEQFLAPSPMPASTSITPRRAASGSRSSKAPISTSPAGPRRSPACPRSPSARSA